MHMSVHGIRMKEDEKEICGNLRIQVTALGFLPFTTPSTGRFHLFGLPNRPLPNSKNKCFNNLGAALLWYVLCVDEILNEIRSRAQAGRAGGVLLVGRGSTSYLAKPITSLVPGSRNDGLTTDDAYRTEIL